MPTDPAARDHPTALFYGDSIVTGWRGTTEPRHRWSSLVSDQLRWREVSLAVNGMGFVRRRGAPGPTGEPSASASDTTLLDAGIRLAPSIVVVCLAANDLGHVDEHGAEVHASIRRDFEKLRVELPTTPVVVTTYFPTADLSPRAARLDRWVIDAAADFGHTYVAEFRTAIAGRPDLLCDDLTHPNDAGHAALAEAVLPTLQRLNRGLA